MQKWALKKSRWDQSQPSEPEERDLLHIPPPAFHLYIYTSLSLSLINNRISHR